MRYKVYLSSDEYGSEEFTYDTEAEQRAGVSRLITRAREEFRKDGVVREVKAVVGWSEVVVEAEDLAEELRLMRERYGEEVEQG